MEFPSDLKYTEDHEWVRVIGDTVRVGITAFATQELGDVVFVELPDEGSTLKKGDTFGVVESVKSVSDLFVPVGGEVVSCNDALEYEPEKVNEDPYGDGWMIEIRIENPSELDALLDASAYESKVE